MKMSPIVTGLAAMLFLATTASADGNSYANFEASQVHPLALTPSGGRLLVVNTPDATVDLFDVDALSGDLSYSGSIPVGLEPVSVTVRSETEAWVANHLSDTVSVLDLTQGIVVTTLQVGDEPTDIAFANGKAFVAVSQEDRVKVYTLADLSLPPTVLDLFANDIRALAASTDGTKVYAVPLLSGNQTTAIKANVIVANDSEQRAAKLATLGLNDLSCDTTPPPYPPLPPGITRNPALTDPVSGVPEVGLILQWNNTSSKWEDDAGQDWTDCMKFRLPDHDLFVIDTTSLAVTTVDHLGTSLFEVSVNPDNGKIYIPHTEARNLVRFEHALGVQGHVVDNRMSVVDPANSFSVDTIDLNSHINRGSDPATNLAERQASISQPGMMAWTTNGATAYVTAIGSNKLFRLDGSCASAACIFGATRATPDAADVGEGPTGVALNEGAGKAYVLERFSNTIGIVDTTSLTKIGEIALNDISSAELRDGRRFLYDAVLSSGHGDAACSSCHLSGDHDGLAWDLGNPEGALVPYGTPGDNVVFIAPGPTGPVECDPGVCAGKTGFDPQKGPMTTQTLRAMIEPLHWRGDRGTMLAFNGAFVGLLGTAQQLPAQDMEAFRDFAMQIRLPSNPYRNLDDTLPNTDVSIPDHPRPGNPATGLFDFDTLPSDAAAPCIGCHSHPFGTAGGKLGGIEPGDPNSDKGALLNGLLDLTRHFDVKVAHLRNMYEKIGPVFGPDGGPYPDRKSGFGYQHDGAMPDLASFLCQDPFSLEPDEIEDIAMFMLHFPTETKPAVGRQVTLPPGTPPTGLAGDEALLTSLVALGDANDVSRHCELVASAIAGSTIRQYRLSAGMWLPDASGDPSLTVTALREGATSPITFHCGTLGSSTRLGNDRDEDGVLNADDCAPAEGQTWVEVLETDNLNVDKPGMVAWQDVSLPAAGPTTYDVVSGALADLRSSGFTVTETLATGLATTQYDDVRVDPLPGSGVYYLSRAVNACGPGTFGLGREALD